jgi:hypothetical protein
MPQVTPEAIEKSIESLEDDLQKVILFARV